LQYFQFIAFCPIIERTERSVTGADKRAASRMSIEEKRL